MTEMTEMTELAELRKWGRTRTVIGVATLVLTATVVAAATQGSGPSQVEAALRATEAPPNAIWIDSLDHRDLGVFTDAFSTTVPAHGAMLVKVGGQPRPDVASFEGLLIGPPPAALKFDPFYEKYADAYGIPIIAGKVVEDTALLVARDIVNYMLLKRPDVRAEMVRQNYRVGIIGRDQGQTDLPEYRDYKKPAIDDRRLTPRERERYNLPGGIASMTDAEYWNGRARGLGGRYTTSGEENLLGIPRSRYYGEHILVHEFSHGIMSAFRTVDPGFHAEIQKAYDAAKAKGLFKGHYAENTVAEYWAEGTQWWFWSNFPWNAPTGERLWTPDSLKAYDPVLFELLGRVYASHRIPADIYHARDLRK